MNNVGNLCSGFEVGAGFVTLFVLAADLVIDAIDDGLIPGGAQKGAGKPGG